MTVPTIDYASPEPGNKRRPSLGFYVVLVLASLFVLALVIPSPGCPAREKARQIRCASNLRQLGQACQLYASDNGSQYPPDLQTIAQTQSVPIQVFVCADSCGKSPGDLAKPGHCSYVYVGTGLTSKSDPGCVVALEDPANHGLEGANVLFADGHVEYMDLVPVMNILNELNAGYNPPRVTQTMPTVANAKADYEKNWKSRMAQLKTGVWRIPATQPGL